MSILTDDLAAIFADTAVSVPVIVAGVTYRGFKTSEQVPVTDASGQIVLATDKSVLMNSVDAAAASLALGVAMTIDGVAATCREVRARGHGQMCDVVFV